MYMSYTSTATAPAGAGQDLFTRKARVILDFIVIGASVTGLACAYNLLSAGHNVRILEKSSEYTKVSRQCTYCAPISNARIVLSEIVWA